MPSEVTQKLEDDLKVIMDKMGIVKNEALDLYNLYWKGTVNTDNPGGATAATTTASGSFEGNDISNAVSLWEDVDDFFTNSAVTTTDYLATLEKLLHGDNPVGTAISSDIEDFGARSLTLAVDMLDLYKKSIDAENCYNNAEVSAAVSGMSAHTVVFGASMTKDDLTSAITLIQQYKNMLTNQAVTTGNYQATLAKWSRL